MKQLLAIFALLAVQGSWTQVNVFECSTYVEGLTQTELNGSDEHFGSCIFFDGSIAVGDTSDKLVEASGSIHIADDFHAGGFTDPGGMHLRIETKSELNVVAMEYEDLYAVKRYKKLELGVELPADLLTRIDHYLHDEGTYSDELNPFVEWDVDVKAYFYNETPGWYEVVDGFYYREYVNDTTLNDWVDVGTNFPFRIRYAPPRNGNWTCRIEIKIDSVLAYSSGTFGFNVVESGDPGYVYVHPNQKNLMRGNHMIYPVGQNFVGPEKDGIPWGMSSHLSATYGTARYCTPQQWQEFRDQVEGYFDEGGKFIRLVSSPWSMLLEFEKKGNYYDRLHYAWEQDRLIEQCEDNDVLVMFNLMMQEPFMEYGDYDFGVWDWNKWWRINGVFSYDQSSQVYCYNDNPQETGGKQAHEMFMLEDDLKYHEQRMRYYISRYGYSTSIYEFELLSEPFHLNQKWSDAEGTPPPIYHNHSTDPDTVALRNMIFQAIENFQGRMAWYIKEKMEHWQQLIGVDYSYYLKDWDYESDNKIDKSYQHGNVDIIGVNYYDNTSRKYIAKKMKKNLLNVDKPASEDYNNTYIVNDSPEESFARMVYNFQNWSGKPVIISESDHGDGTHGCSGDAGNRIDAMSMGFTGACGFHVWIGSKEHETDVWPITVRAQQHMNGEDVIDALSEGYGDWVQGRQVAALHDDGEVRKELQYYVSQNGEYAVGYVRNRTYNIHTNRYNDDCYVQMDVNDQVSWPMDISWDDGYSNGLLWVTGLKNNHDYQIDWYSFLPEGWYLESDCQNTNGDKFKLEYPELITTFYDRPMVWFVMRVQNCQSGMVQSDNDGEEHVGQEINDLVNENQMTADELERFGIKVYPNPFEDELIVAVKEEDVANVYTLDGQLVLTHRLGAGENVIYTKDLAKGMYLVKLKKCGKQFKMVKQ